MDHGDDCDDCDDPSDWPLPEWQTADTALRCPVCKEYFRATMILTNCSHNFCSLCIRQALQEQSTADKTCPQCRAPCSTVTQLKANRVVDELVRLVRAVRKQTIEALEGVASGSGSASAKTLEDRVSASVSAKTRKHGVDADTSTASKKRKTMMTAASQDATTLPSRRYPVRQRASASQGNVATVVDEEQDVSPHPATPVMTATRRRTSVTPIAVHVDDETTASEDDDDDAASATAMTQPEEIVLDAKQSPVECPICKRMLRCSNDQFNRHLDECLTLIAEGGAPSQSAPRKQRTSKTPPSLQKPTTTGAAFSTTASLPLQRRAAVQEKTVNVRMSKQWYSGMKDAKLRALLVEHGLPAHGTRKMMEKRHAQFVILWNATCDDPSDYRTKKDLLKALREWEHTQSASGSGSSSSIATGASSASSLHGHKLTVAQDGKYLRQHRSEFANLIAMARPRKVAAEAQVEPPEATVDIDATISATDTSDRASTPAFVQPLSLPDTSTTECCASPIINIALCPKPASKVHQPQPAMASDRDENSGSDVNPIGATTSSAAIPVETATNGRGDDVDGGGCDVDMDDWKLYYPDSDLAFDVSAPAEPPV